MAPDDRGTADSVAHRLLESAYDFDFFQAVRLLMRLFPGRERVGGAAKPDTEVVRFSSRVSLEFPASAIHEITAGAPGEPPRMTVAFMGLMGANGVLPIHYTEWMVLRQAAKDTAMAAFFDIFNHRWISLFYKAWEKYCLPVSYERSQLERTQAPRLCGDLLALVGLRTDYLRGRLSVRDEVLLYYAGLLAQRPRSAMSLRGLLRDYFGVAVEVEQMVGAWCELQDRDLCYLGEPGIHNQLGVGAVAGDQVWDQAGMFRIRLGPVGFGRFCWFLPGARGARELASLTRFFVGAVLAFEWQLVLRGSDVPACRLSAPEPRLGWDTWLAGGPVSYDPDDAAFAEAA